MKELWENYTSISVPDDYWIKKIEHDVEELRIRYVFDMESLNEGFYLVFNDTLSFNYSDIHGAIIRLQKMPKSIFKNQINGIYIATSSNYMNNFIIESQGTLGKLEEVKHYLLVDEYNDKIIDVLALSEPKIEWIIND